MKYAYILFDKKNPIYIHRIKKYIFITLNNGFIWSMTPSFSRKIVLVAIALQLSFFCHNEFVRAIELHRNYGFCSQAIVSVIGVQWPKQLPCPYILFFSSHEPKAVRHRRLSSLTFHIFDISSETAGPILTKPGMPDP